MNTGIVITTGLDAPECLVLRLAGILDGRGATAMVERCALEGIEQRALILNLSAVTAITSSGIGGILALVEERQDLGAVRVAAASPEVLAVIRLLNLDQFIDLDDTEERAIQTARAA